MNLPPNSILTLESTGGLLRELHSPVRILIPNNKNNFVDVGGLWDTGATGSAITKRVVDQLGLIPTGLVHVQTAGGVFVQNQYTIDIHLPNGVLIEGIIATQLDGVVGANSDVLIGMDVITLGDFAITNYQGNTCMSFRVPSCEKIDFGTRNAVQTFEGTYDGKNLARANTTLPGNGTTPKVGRNEPCPCNSGKKYKQCHGKGK